MKKQLYITLLFLAGATALLAQPRLRWQQLPSADTTGAIAIAQPDGNGIWSDSLRWWQGQLLAGADTMATRAYVRSSDTNMANTNLAFSTSRTYNLGTSGALTFSTATTSNLFTIYNLFDNVGIKQALPIYSLDIGATDAMRIPVGTTAQRPVLATQGLLRYDSDLDAYQGVTNSGWTSFQTGSDQHLGSADLTLSADRTHDLSGYDLTLDNGRFIVLDSSITARAIESQTPATDDKIIRLYHSEQLSGTGSVVIETGLTYPSTAAGYVMLSGEYYRYVGSVGDITGTWRAAMFFDGNRILNGQGHITGYWPGEPSVRFYLDADDKIIITLGDTDDYYSNAFIVSINSMSSTVGSLIDYSELDLDLYLSTDLSALEYEDGETNIAGVRIPLVLEYNGQSDSINNVLKIVNPRGGSNDRVGILMSTYVKDYTAVNETAGILIEAVGDGLGADNLVFSTQQTSSISSTAVERFRINHGGAIGVGESSPTYDMHFGTTAGIVLPSGSDAERITGINGAIRHSTTSGNLEAYLSGSWQELATSSGVNNFANSDLTLTGDRSHDLAGYDLTLSDGPFIITDPDGSPNFTMQSTGAYGTTFNMYSGGNNPSSMYFGINASTTAERQLEFRYFNGSFVIRGGPTTFTDIFTISKDAPDALEIESSGIVSFNHTSAIALPSGTDAQRPTGVNGMLRHSTTSGNLEAYLNGSWTELATSIGGTNLFDGAHTLSVSRIHEINNNARLEFNQGGTEIFAIDGFNQAVGLGVEDTDFNSTGVAPRMTVLPKSTGGSGENSGIIVTQTRGIDIPSGYFSAYSDNYNQLFKGYGGNSVITSVSDASKWPYHFQASKVANSQAYGLALFQTDVKNDLTNADGYGIVHVMKLDASSTSIGFDNYEAFTSRVDLESTTNPITITNLYDYRIVEGAGTNTTITNRYGFYADISDDFTTNPYFIYGAGNAPSFFGGNIEISNTTPTIYLHDSAVPSNDYSIVGGTSNIFFKDDSDNNILGIGSNGQLTTYGRYNQAVSSGSNNMFNDPIQIGGAVGNQYITASTQLKLVAPTNPNQLRFEGSYQGAFLFQSQRTSSDATLVTRLYAYKDAATDDDLEWSFMNSKVGIGTDQGSNRPLVSLDMSNVSDALALPSGSDGERPTGVNGYIRYSETANNLEAYINGSWAELSTGGSNLSGSGVANRVAIWDGSSSFTNDITLSFDPTANQLSVGTPTVGPSTLMVGENNGTFPTRIARLGYIEFSNSASFGTGLGFYSEGANRTIARYGSTQATLTDDVIHSITSGSSGDFLTGTSGTTKHFIQIDVGGGGVINTASNRNVVGLDIQASANWIADRNGGYFAALELDLDHFTSTGTDSLYAIRMDNANFSTYLAGPTGFNVSKPAYSVHVNGSIANSTGQKILWQDNETEYVSQIGYATGRWQLRQNDVESILVDANGNVGFGNFGTSTVTNDYNLYIKGTTGIKVSVGSTAQRGTGENGAFRYNSDNDEFEGYINGTWTGFSTGGSGIGGTLTDDYYGVYNSSSGEWDDGLIQEANANTTVSIGNSGTSGRFQVNTSNRTISLTSGGGSVTSWNFLSGTITQTFGTWRHTSSWFAGTGSNEYQVNYGSSLTADASDTGQGSSILVGGTITYDASSTAQINGIRLNHTVDANAGDNYRAVQIDNAVGYGIYQSNINTDNYFGGQIGLGKDPTTAIEIDRTDYDSDLISFNLSGTEDGFLKWNAGSTTQYKMGKNASGIFRIFESSATGGEGLSYDEQNQAGFFGINIHAPNYVLDINSTDAIQLPAGTTAQRPTNSAGILRWSTSLSALEYGDGTSWHTISAGDNIATANLTFTAVREHEIADNTLTFNGAGGDDLFVIDGDGAAVGIGGTTNSNVALTIGGTEGMKHAEGTTAQRPTTPSSGMERYDTDKAATETYADGAWHPTMQTDKVQVIGAGGTLVVSKNMFLTVDMLSTSQTLTLDPTNLTDGSKVMLFVETTNSFTLDSDTGNFIEVGQSSAGTKTIDDGVYLVEWMFSNWYFIQIQ